MELVSFFFEILVEPRLFNGFELSFDTFLMILDHHQEPEVVVALESYPTLEGKPHSILPHKTKSDVLISHGI